jgi:hypothetical protein
MSDEAAKRAAADSTKYDGVSTERDVTHDPELDKVPTHKKP